MAATFASRSTVSPPRLTRQFQFVSDSGLHHPPALCCRETNLLPSLNAFLFSFYEIILFYAICQAVGFVYNEGVWFFQENQLVPIRFLHFEQSRIVIDVAGPSSAITAIFEQLRQFLSRLQAADGSAGMSSAPFSPTSC